MFVDISLMHIQEFLSYLSMYCKTILLYFCHILNAVKLQRRSYFSFYINIEYIKSQ